jgi:hypothetical protein
MNNDLTLSIETLHLLFNRYMNIFILHHYSLPRERIPLGFLHGVVVRLYTAEFFSEYSIPLVKSSMPISCFLTILPVSTQSHLTNGVEQSRYTLLLKQGGTLSSPELCPIEQAKYSVQGNCSKIFLQDALNIMT